MPALPLTATQQAPLQSLFASSPFDTLTDSPNRPATTRPHSASFSSSSSPSATVLTPPHSLTASPHRRNSTTTTSSPALPTPLASLTFTTSGPCRSVTIANPAAHALQLHISTTERRALRANGFRLADVKGRLVVPARSERPLVVVWDGRAAGSGETGGRVVKHELRLESAGKEASAAIVIRLSATIPLVTAATTAAVTAAPSTRPAQRRPLRKLTDWFTAVSTRHAQPVDLFNTSKQPRSTRSNSTSATADTSTASASSSCTHSSPPSPCADDEWSSPRHASEPPVLSPLRHQHCYTLSAADVYTLNNSGSGSADNSSSPITQSTERLPDRHARSFSFPVQTWPLAAE